MDHPTQQHRILSPNTVIANSLNRTIDVIRPHITRNHPHTITFVVGVQINGAPHVGTYLTLGFCFVLAREARRIFGVNSNVEFDALDNALSEVITDPESFHSYQQCFWQTTSKEDLYSILRDSYLDYFNHLTDVCATEYTWKTYSEIQADREFRAEFLKSLKHLESLKWCISPSKGAIGIRLPCPDCGYSEKHGERTFLREVRADEALFSCYCWDHGYYEATVTLDNHTYVDLNTIYRNVIKEATLCKRTESMYVVVKGGDWAFSTPLVDQGLSLLGYSTVQTPPRLFVPQIVTPTGAKLSKSLIRERCESVRDVPEWIMDMSKFRAGTPDYADRMVWLIEKMMDNPKHTFRSYAYQEIITMLDNYTPQPKVRHIQIYDKYYRMIESGEKTIEVRVGYSGMRRIQAGDVLCFNQKINRRVVRVAEYKSFEDMFKSEDARKINPHETVPQQLAAIRTIFPKHKEDLGVLIFDLTNP